MDVFVPAAGPRSRTDFCRENGIGLLYSPHRPEIPTINDALYIVDNGAFPAYLKGQKMSVPTFRRFMKKITRCKYSPSFVCIPDIVAGGKDSLEFSIQNIEVIPKQFKKYFVVQDGLSPEDIEDSISSIDGIFVGGTVIWKWRTAHIWVEFSHQHNIKCHIGRVGTWRNFLRAHRLGADSIDGSTLMRHNKLHKINQWRDEIAVQSRVDVPL